MNINISKSWIKSSLFSVTDSNNIESRNNEHLLEHNYFLQGITGISILNIAWSFY